MTDHLFKNRQHGVAMKNIGGIDNILRIVLGLLLITMIFIGPKTAWGWLGLVPLVTGLISFCPLYKIFGLSTCKL